MEQRYKCDVAEEILLGVQVRLLFCPEFGLADGDDAVELLFE